MTDGVERGRKRLSAEVRRAQLETAAIKIVAQRGFAAASADAIAQLAGVSKGLLWHYYADLGDLMANAARRALTVLESAVAESIDRDAPVPDLLRAAIARAALLPATHGSELRAVRQIADNLRAVDGTAILRAAEYDQLHARQAKLIGRGQREGDIRSDLDPYLLAVSYQGMVDTMLDHIDNHPELDVSAYAEHVATVLLEGIGARPPGEAKAGGVGEPSMLHRREGEEADSVAKDAGGGCAK